MMKEGKEIKKILFISLDNIGDMIMASSMIAPVKKEYPDAELSVWAKEYTHELLEGISEKGIINRVFASDPVWTGSPGRGRGRLWHFLKKMTELRKESFDMAVIANADWRRALSACLMGIPVRLGYDRKRSRFLLTNTVEFFGKDEHIIDGHKRLLRCLGTGAGDMRPGLALSSGQMEFQAKTYENSVLKARPRVALNISAGDPRRCWPLERWSELAGKISAAWGGSLLLACGPADRDMAERVMKTNGSGKIYSAHIHSTGELFSLIGGCDLFIGNDSGPTHMAASLSVPVIALFGYYSPGYTGPRGYGRVEFIYRAPLDTITVDEAFRKAESLLGEKQ